jgi:hypothetical protein
VSETAAAEETLASPNRSKTIEGRQHIDARIAEPEINFHSDFDSSRKVNGSLSEEGFSSSSSILPFFLVIILKFNVTNFWCLVC